MTEDGTEPGEDRVPLEIYEQLKKATPKEKTDIVLRLIEDHPEGRLVLPQRDGVHAHLCNADLSSDTLKARLRQLNVKSAPWWNDYRHGANLEAANLQSADLGSANLQDADLGISYRQVGTLEGANLQGAQLRNTRLEEVDLAGCHFLLGEVQAMGLSPTRGRSVKKVHAGYVCRYCGGWCAWNWRMITAISWLCLQLCTCRHCCAWMWHRIQTSDLVSESDEAA